MKPWSRNDAIVAILFVTGAVGFVVLISAASAIPQLRVWVPPP